MVFNILAECPVGEKEVETGVYFYPSLTKSGSVALGPQDGSAIRYHRFKEVSVAELEAGRPTRVAGGNSISGYFGVTEARVTMRADPPKKARSGSIGDAAIYAMEALVMPGEALVEGAVGLVAAGAGRIARGKTPKPRAELLAGNLYYRWIEQIGVGDRDAGGSWRLRIVTRAQVPDSPLRRLLLQVTFAPGEEVFEVAQDLVHRISRRWLAELKKGDGQEDLIAQFRKLLAVPRLQMKEEPFAFYHLPASIPISVKKAPGPSSVTVMPIR
ncbi:hypothetical protein FAGKG844_700022 [Frankia sp. AgKG'84/4]